MLDDIFFMVAFFESLASQGPEKISSRNALLVARPIVIVFTTVAPWDVLAVDIGNNYQLLQDVNDGPLGGAADRSDSSHHRD
jgi:hypothetical protein